MKTFIIILILAGSLVYAFNLTNQLFWDDTDWIVRNQFVHEISFSNIGKWFTENVLGGIGLKSNYYRPLLMASFTLNFVLGGDSPIGYHVFSNALHIANGILLFFLLHALFKKKWAAWIAALIFLLHPLQTEAVTYISGRGDPLSVFWMLLALIFFLRGKRIVPLFLLALALLSRESAIVFPFLIMVVSMCSEQDTFWRSLKKSFLKALPYFGIVVFYGILRLTVLNFDNTLNFYAAQNIYTESFFVRMYTFMGILPEYLKLLIAPAHLHMDRVPVVYTAFSFWQVFVPFFAIIIFAAALWIYLKRRSKRHENEAIVWFFAFAWFFVGLGPTSGITPINAQMYEHWLYLPLIGPAFLLGYYFEKLFLFSSSRRKWIPIAIGIGILCWWGSIGIKRNILWGKPLEFYKDILKYEPKSARINNNVGNLYYYGGNSAEAEKYYLIAAENTEHFAQPYFNLGNMKDELGDKKGALEMYERAVAADPSFFYGYQRIAVAAAAIGEFEKSYAALLKLSELTPLDPRVYLNLAKIDILQKRIVSAKDNINKGIGLSDSDVDAQKELLDLLDQIK